MAADGPFIRSCEEFLDYPKNLVQHDALGHTIKAYYARLNSRSNLFQDHQAAVDFLDLYDGAAAFRPKCIPNLRELRTHLGEALKTDQTDPRCRFVFLHAPHSRAPLRITRQMLAFLFSYHQIVPCFLDFVFPFGKQVYAEDFYFSGLREESRIASGGNTLPALHRSGFDLRLCYNLRSVENTTQQPGLPWSIRQAAVYHEFDIKTGRTLWVVVKGNKVIKDRIAEASALAPLNHIHTRGEAFAASLLPHLLLCEWSGENWRWYINALEDELQNQTRDVLATRVERPPSSPSSPVPFEEPMSPRSRSSSFPLFSRSGTGQTSCPQKAATGNFSPRTNFGFSPPMLPSSAPNLVNVLSVSDGVYGMPTRHENERDKGSRHQNSTLTTLFHRVKGSNMLNLNYGSRNMSQQPLTSAMEMSSPPLSPSGKTLPKELPPTFSEKGHDGSHDTHTFGDSQRIQYIEEKAQEALLILKQNTEVLEELKQYYTYATDHASFPLELSAECSAQLARFSRCISGVEKDMKMLQSRTETLIHLLGNRKNLLNGILQYSSAKASESSAKRAEASTKYMATLTQDMHEIAQQTKRETVSMRVITSVTLFFLPATFIATFMSTNILNFENGKQDLHINGLKVYLAVALPLTALTFFAWFVIYRFARQAEWSSNQAAEIKDGSNV